ncbi:MAG: DUF427 domain-containing protein [Pseudomonadota bacterium]|nr:MAG: DUF427 domain-containing protein [Pseudomonadota bacterium]
MKAVWSGTNLADSDNCLVVEGNYYFPPESVNHEYLQESDKRTECHWKGVAHYYHVRVAGKLNPDAAWYYPAPLSAAAHITGYIAFWRGVEVK